MKRLEELFHEAVVLGPKERAEFIARVRESNPELVIAVESLIAAHERPDSLLDMPAYEAAGELITEAPAALEADQRLGHYQVIAPIGKGGMGEVYLATDTRLDRKVALKLLPAALTGNKERLHRFIQEAKTASSLNHPNIITIHEIGQATGVRFFATEFIDGQTLRRRLAQPKMEFSEVLDVSIQTASALQAAHAAGIIHRDIKPENIMLRRDGYVKVLDFGLAKLTGKFRQTNPIPADSAIATMAKIYTEPGTVMGTVNYMSPEQARCQEVDPRTDLFSLGLVMYEMAAGRMAFAGDTAVDSLVAILEKDPPPLDQCAPNVPAEFQRIINKALRKDREERYQTSKDLLIDLKNLKEELAFEQKIERSHPRVSESGVSNTGSASESVTVLRNAADVGDIAAGIGRSSKRSNRTQRLVTLTLLSALIASVAIGAAVMLWQRNARTPVVSAPSSALETMPERSITYGITVQKYRANRPYQEPFRLRDDINFEKDYRIRLHVTSAQSGRLYLLNEGPAAAGQAPMLKVLFPSETANNGSAILKENQEIQIPQQTWYAFDDKRGTEKIWLVWAEKDVPELEAVKGFVNRKDQGVISSLPLLLEVNRFLEAHSKPGVSVERDDEKKETHVKAKGEILVHAVKLEHN